MLSAPRSTKRLKLGGVFFVFVAATIWSWLYIKMTFSTLFGGFDDLWNLLQYMFPPRFDQMGQVIDATIETLWMALIGMTASVILSIPLAFGAARNTTPNAATFAVCRAIITLARAVPTLIIAAIFVLAVGIGPLGGILALALHSIGMIGKLYTEAIESATEAPRDAVSSTGASKWQTILATIVPQATPTFIGAALYRLDINVRESAVLGWVGAGGIGFVIQTALRGLDYSRALAAVSVIFVVITLIEISSNRLRASIIGEQSAVITKNQKARKKSTERDHKILLKAVTLRKLNLPWTSERRLRISAVLFYAGLLILALVTIKIPIISSFGYLDEIFKTSADLFPPDFNTARPEIIRGILETIAIGFVATILGLLIALPLALLAARNIVVNRVIYSGTRLFMLAFRGIPELIVAVLFVSAMGLGPVPGTLALTLGTAFFMAKLIADTLEEVAPEPRDAIFATGATRSQEFFAAVLPQAMPNLVSQTLYLLDVNLRSSTVLGIVGGGGIGFLLLSALRVIEYQTVGAILILTFVVVYAIELLGSWVRKLVE